MLDVLSRGNWKITVREEPSWVVPTPDETFRANSNQSHAAQVADPETDASAAKDALLRVWLGSADVRGILVRHLMQTLTLIDTIVPDLAPFHTGVPMEYITEIWEQNRKEWCMFS